MRHRAQDEYGKNVKDHAFRRMHRCSACRALLMSLAVLFSIRFTQGHMLMKRISLAVVCTGLMLANASVQAVDTDAVIGGALGGAAGAAVGSELGGRNGAIAGSAVGAAIGTAITADGDGSSHGEHDSGSRVHYEDDHDRRGPPAHAYRVPPGHVKNGKH